MPYRLTYFDDTPLPVAMPRDDLSTGQVDTSLVDSVGNAYNYHGTAQRFPRRQVIPHRGLYVGEMAVRVTSDGDVRVTDDGTVRVTAPSKVADLQGKTDDLKAKIGVWGQLWRERLADGVLTWKRARLLQVVHVETISEANAVSEVESRFESNMAGWHSAEPVTTSGSATDGVPLPLIVENAGSMPVSDAILSVERTSGTITAVQVTGAGIDLTWTGSIGAGETLVLDMGDLTALLGTSDAYDGLALGAGHTGNEWLTLPVGARALTVTVTGGNATVSIEHFDQWP